MAKKNKVGGLWSEFKAFISRGNVLDMAVGVVIGGAFSAIVTAVVNILLSVCTWGVPGGLNGLITVLPVFPGSAAQAGLDPSIVANYGDALQFTASLGQKFNKDALQALAEAWANATYTPEVVAANPNLIEREKKCAEALMNAIYNWSNNNDYNAVIAIQVRNEPDLFENFIF